jgi:MazG family protein
LKEIDELIDIMVRLRGENGCNWDKKQTYDTLREFIIEEAYEVVDAVESKNFEHMKEELGDLLFNIVFYAQIASEDNKFSIADVAKDISEKLIRRHPHVFNVPANLTPDEVLANWNKIKQQEKINNPKPDSILDGIPKSLPSILRAEKLQKSAAKVGFDWASVEDVKNKLHEEIEELYKEIEKDEQIKFWEKLANLFTPLSKYYISEMANRIADNALQIHGGSGYTEDYVVSKIYRDARITNIYEGTTQLQIVACIGGVVSGMSPTGFLRAYLDKETSKFAATDRLLRVRKLFESIASSFAEIKDSATRDSLAFEVVESTARCINGILLERSASRLKDKQKTDRLALAAEYHIDSLAILESNLIKLQERGKIVA